VNFARRSGVAVSTRGQAHSQSGQTLTEGGLVVTTAGLGRVLEVDRERRTVVCEGGALWRDVVAETLRHGLIPPVLTNNLNVSVGGTLSVAGLGIASFRHGTQADNVEELSVVTGLGEIETCSREARPDLFDAVRAGLGQFGIIARAKLALKPARSRVRTYYLLYDDIGLLMEDAGALMQEGRYDDLESWCVPCAQGFRSGSAGPQTFAEWFYPLHASIEYDPADPPSDEKALAGLSYYRHVHTEERSMAEFAGRLEPLFELWRRSGYWAGAHPWMETILPWDRAAGYVRGVLADFPPTALGGGHVLLWPSRGAASSAPLFMRPEGSNVMGFGILPGLPREVLPAVAPLLDRASDLSLSLGAKRYLSGRVNFDETRWRTHFGPKWPGLREMKRRFDPDHILNAGFIPL
jgi:FAD/FMN-containing dehydrogenase